MEGFRLVVNADDLGYSMARNSGIIECVKRGVVTSCSLMVTAECMREAVDMLRPYSVSLGLHLNLSEGTPLSSGLQTLIGSNGMFHGKMEIRRQAEELKLDMLEVEKEVIAQMERFIEVTGSLPSHVDGHQHVHVIPGIIDVISGILNNYGVERIRVPLQHGVYGSASFEPEKLIHSNNSYALTARDIFSDKKLRWPAYFLGLTTMGDMLTLEHLETALNAIYTYGSKNSDGAEKAHEKKSPGTIIELMVHPGYACDDLKGGCGLGTDAFSRSTQREHEMNFLMSEDFKLFVGDNNMKLCSYNSV